MFSPLNALALLSVLATGAFAADVYSHFNDAAGAEIGTTQFDVSNRGCFSVPNAAQISFTQNSPNGIAHGPYCLTGYANGGCGGQATQQQFHNIEINDGKNYELNEGLAAVGSYRWSPKGC